jgi:hypothetical protein
VSELRKAALAASKPVLVLRHESSFAAAGAIALAPCYLITLYIVEPVYGDLTFAWNLFIRHYLLPPLAAPLFEVAASCLALSLAAFSSSSIFFLSSLESVLSSL